MFEVTSSLRDALAAAAVEAAGRAYAPYSNFPVGAALLCDDGDIVAGCNVENASYGLTMCAERVAVGNAVASGRRGFRMLAIACRGGVTPCGACRQVLAEFDSALPVLMVDLDDAENVVERNLRELLPGVFRLPEGDG